MGIIKSLEAAKTAQRPQCPLQLALDWWHLTPQEGDVGAVLLTRLQPLSDESAEPWAPPTPVFAAVLVC